MITFPQIKFHTISNPLKKQKQKQKFKKTILFSHQNKKEKKNTQKKKKKKKKKKKNPSSFRSRRASPAQTSKRSKPSSPSPSSKPLFCKTSLIGKRASFGTLSSSSSSSSPSLSRGTRGVLKSPENFKSESSSEESEDIFLSPSLSLLVFLTASQNNSFQSFFRAFLIRQIGVYKTFFLYFSMCRNLKRSYFKKDLTKPKNNVTGRFCKYQSFKIKLFFVSQFLCFVLANSDALFRVHEYSTGSHPLFLFSPFDLVHSLK